MSLAQETSLSLMRVGMVTPSFFLSLGWLYRSVAGGIRTPIPDVAGRDPVPLNDGHVGGGQGSTATGNRTPVARLRAWCPPAGRPRRVQASESTAGFEPALPGFVDRCLVHWATSTWRKVEESNPRPCDRLWLSRPA